MVVVDLSRFPLVITTISGRLSLADADLIISEQYAILRRGLPHVNLFDATQATERPDAIVRRRLGEFTGRSAFLSKRSALGSALVIPNPVLRGVVTSIHWIGRPLVPTKHFADVGGGLAWCLAELRKVGLDIPSGGAPQRESFGFTATRLSHVHRVGVLPSKEAAERVTMVEKSGGERCTEERVEDRRPSQRILGDGRKRHEGGLPSDLPNLRASMKPNGHPEACAVVDGPSGCTTQTP